VRTTPAPRGALVAALLLAATVGCTAAGGSGPTPSSSPTASPSAGVAAPTAGTPEPSAAPTAPADVGAEEPAAGADPGGADEGSTDPGTTGPVPTLTLATLVDGQVELAGFVAGVVSEGGACRFELVGGGTVARAESTAIADATVTTCPGVTVPAPAGAPDTWRARLVWVETGARSPEVTVTRG